MAVLDTFRLDGQVAVVTGARRGIGLGMAVALAEAGADIVAVARRFEDDEPLRDLVEATGRTISLHAVDLGHRGQVDGFLADLDDAGKRVDILVNNAGIIDRTPSVDHNDDIWDEVVEVDLTTPFRLARAIGASMLERGRGKIIMVGSVLSFQGGINVASYAAAKHGLIGVTQALANEWASRGVNVNAIAPGYITTDATEALRLDTERSAALASRIPAGRWGVPEDLAGATVFLASRASDYVNGTTIAVDGGWLSR